MKAVLNLLTLIIFSLGFVHAGDFVFGPVKVEVGPNGKGEKTFEFEVPSTRATYVVDVHNGYMLYEGKGEKVKKGEIYINGRLVMTFDDSIPLRKPGERAGAEVKLRSKNIMVVKVWGSPGSFASIHIIEAPLNPPVCNEDCSLSVENMGPSSGVLIYWARFEEEGIEYYVFYRSEGKEGPWKKLYTIGWRYRSGPAVDDPPDLDKKTYCYKVEAVKGGKVVRVLGPVCVPPYRYSW